MHLACESPKPDWQINAPAQRPGDYRRWDRRRASGERRGVTERDQSSGGTRAVGCWDVLVLTVAMGSDCGRCDDGICGRLEPGE